MAVPHSSLPAPAHLAVGSVLGRMWGEAETPQLCSEGSIPGGEKAQSHVTRGEVREHARATEREAGEYRLVPGIPHHPKYGLSWEGGRRSVLCGFRDGNEPTDENYIDMDFNSIFKSNNTVSFNQAHSESQKYSSGLSFNYSI